MVDYLELREPSEDQKAALIALYREAGWWDRAATDDAHIDGLVRGSHCFVVAVEAGALIGMGRAISDRVSDAYLQDVMVTKACRGRGIGAAIVRRVVARLKADGLPWIGAIAESGSLPFYQHLGFQVFEGAQPIVLKH